MAKEVTMYESDDGKLFPSLKLAEDYETALVYDTAFRGDTSYTGGFLRLATVGEFKAYLTRNEKWIQEMMGWTKL